jgi:TolB-like protein
VRRESDAVRITLKLVDARTDQHVWSRSYDRQLVRSMSLQSGSLRKLQRNCPQD